MLTKNITRREPWLLVLALLGLLWQARPVQAQGPAVSEDELKAAFLYNFTRFVEWPEAAFADQNSPIEVAVFEGEDFTRLLSTLLKDKKAHGRPFKVRNFEGVAAAGSPHLLFIPKERSRSAAQLIESVEAKPVLTVGESPQFLSHGGIINFRFQENQLRFEINGAGAEKAKLEISSQLMRLAVNAKKGAAQ